MVKQIRLPINYKFQKKSQRVLTFYFENVKVWVSKFVSNNFWACIEKA